MKHSTLLRIAAKRISLLLLALLCLPLTMRADNALGVSNDNDGFYFSYFTTGVYTKDTSTFKEPTLTVPADYTGNVTYASSNTSIATVDASTGKVTYVGRDKGLITEGNFNQKYDFCGDVTITAKFPADSKYKERTLEYHIFYCNSKKTVKSKADWDWLGQNEVEYHYFKRSAASTKRDPNANTPNDWGTSSDFLQGEKCVRFYHTYLVDVQADFALENSKDGGGNITFRGYVEGNGHTITVTYTLDNGSWAPLSCIYGVVKNLKVKGSIQTERSIQGRGASAFVRYVSKRYGSFYTDKTVYYDYPKAGKGPTAIFDGCVNEVTYSQAGTALFGANKSRMGGFLDHVNEGDSVIFNDCHFAGNIDTDKCERFGGFVTFKYKGSLLTFRNCAVDLSQAKAKRKGSYAGYFIGWDEEAKNSFFSNCYYVPASGSISLEKPKNIPQAKKDSLADGSLAYTLGAHRTGDANPWCQTIGTDAIPRIKAISPQSLEVFYQAKAVAGKTADNGWSTFISPTNPSFTTGVKAYVVTSIDEENKQIMLSSYSGSYKGVPLLLKTEGSAQSYTIPAGHYNRPATASVLLPAYDALSAKDKEHVLSGDNFVKTTDAIPAWSCYLTTNSDDAYTLASVDGSSLETIYRIASNEDWNNFCTSFSGASVKAFLTADLTLTDTDKHIENFVGTFDGQGHCITDNSASNCVFTKAQGAIKNLRVETTSASCALVGQTSGNLAFTDCKVQGSLFLQNNNHTVKRSHTLEFSSLKWYAAYGEDASSTTEVSSTDLKNGCAAYQLNAGRTGDNAVWKQTINEDDQPQLMSTTSKEVFHAEASKRAAEADKKWSTIYYPADLDLSSLTDLRVYDDFGLSADTLFAYENLSGQLSANTPAIIQCESGLPEISLPETYYNKEVVDQNEALVGLYEEADVSNRYTLTTETAQAEEGKAEAEGAETETVAFTSPTESTTLPAWQCYATSAGRVEGDGTVITSKADWEKFKTRYTGRNANVRLVCDLTLTSSDEPMDHFMGTFNGTMSTITLNGASAPFKTAEGKIKQITLAGTPADSKGALVGSVSDALQIQDCISTAGAFTSDDQATYNSCLIINSDGSETAGTAYYGYNGKAEAVTVSQIESGEVTYRLNAGRTGDNAFWRQTITKDGAPSLASYTAEEVYLAADTVRLGSAGWATHYFPLECALPDGVKAYTFAGVTTTDGESLVSLTEVETTIPAYTPVLLCSLTDDQATEAAKSYTIPMTNFYFNTLEDKFVEAEGNFQLLGVADSLETFDGCYVLQQHTDAQGKKHTAFYRVDESVGCPVVPAWRCVLIDTSAFTDDETEEGTEEGEKTQAVHLRLDGTTTSISAAAEALNDIMADGTTYDLSGRRVGNLQKGNVYIKNGQKFIIK